MSNRTNRKLRRYAQHFCGKNYEAPPPQKKAAKPDEPPRLRALPPFADRARDLRKRRQAWLEERRNARRGVR